MGIKAAAQPEIKGEIVMRRHQIGIVIGALRIDIVTACRLHADSDIAEAQARIPIGIVGHYQGYAALGDWRAPQVGPASRQIGGVGRCCPRPARG
jgi:hypothetical protein